MTDRLRRSRRRAPRLVEHRFASSETDGRYFEERLGTPLDRLTNAYALFLLKIWEDLAPHGRAVVILACCSTGTPARTDSTDPSPPPNT